MTPATEQFLSAIRAAGIQPPDMIEAGGKLRRFSSNGKPGDDAGWYVLHDDNGIPAGAFGCWRSGVSETWRADIGRKLTPAEEAAHRAKVEAIRREREAEEARRQAEAREKAAAIWKAAQPATNDHPYLIAKGVKSFGLRVHEGQLVIPMRDGRDRHSLQFIGPGGEKRFLTGGRVKGCYFSIGKPDGVLCIAEGYATAASVHEATGYAVAVAFNAGNLEAVARALRAKFPRARIVICADNDASGTGQQKAEEAARAVGEAVAIPTGTGKDWNDIYREQGAEAVRNTIVQGVQHPKLRLVPIGELLSAPQENTRWLVDGLLPASGISLLAARPKVGKSTLVRALARCVARGEEFLDLATSQGAVFILDLEGKRGETVNALRQLGITAADPIKVFCGSVPQGALDELRAAALIDRPALIIVDTMQRLVRVSDLNDYAKVTLALDPYISLARDTGAHLIFLHHQGRSEGEGVDSPMGSTAIAGSADTILTMKRRGDGTRTLSSVQRYGNDLDETVVALEDGGDVIASGLMREHEKHQAASRIVEFLEAAPDSEQADIREGVEGRWSVVRAALTELVKTEGVSRSGSGRKGDAFKYRNSGSRGSLGTSGTRKPEFAAEEIGGKAHHRQAHTATGDPESEAF